MGALYLAVEGASLLEVNMRRMRVKHVQPGSLVCELDGAEVVVIGTGPRPDQYVYAVQVDGIWRLTL